MRRLLLWFILITCVLLIYNVSRTLSELFAKGNVIGEANARLTRVQKENEELTQALTDVQSPAYIEKQAREKLNMAKEGEVVVIVPSIVVTPTPVPTRVPASWEQWVGLFAN